MLYGNNINIKHVAVFAVLQPHWLQIFITAMFMDI
jgi:uncharacterized membrane protein